MLQYDDIVKAQTGGQTTAPVATVPAPQPSGLQYNDLVKAQSTPVIAADQMGATKALEVPTLNPTTTKADSAIAGATQATKTYDQYFKEATPTKTQEQEKVSTVNNRILELLDQTAGKTQAVGQEEARLGVPDMSKELAILNADSQRQVAEYNQIKTNYEKLIKDEENKTQSLSKIRGAQGRLARDMAFELNIKASENAITQALAMGKQGMIEQAQKAAERSVDLRYAAVEEELKIKKDQLLTLKNSGILNEQEEAQAIARERMYKDEQEAIEVAKEKQKDNITLAINNNVPTRFVNRGGEFFSVSDGKPFSNPEDFFKAAGVSSFQEAYDKGLVTDVSGTDKVLSVAEANALNVPYGTTEREAMKMKITPQTATEAKKNNSPKSPSPNSPDASKVKATPDSVRSWILQNKKANPTLPYYELWGQLAEELESEGIPVANFDKVFWEMLHPEGLKGYEAEQKKKSGASSTGGIVNPFAKPVNQ